MLTLEQLKAAHAFDRRAAVVAGAGAGKTRVIIERVRWLVEGGVHPSEILVITFTRAAAEEVRQRLKHDVRAGTFHAIALEGHPHEAYVLDPDESMRLMDTVNDSKESTASLAKKIRKGAPSKSAERLKQLYQATLNAQGMIDFDGLIESLQKQADDDFSKIRQYRHILIDEAQDIDDQQLAVLLKLHQRGANLFFVGDVRQCIYRWRGAIGERFLDEAERYYLTKGFRNPEDVTVASNAVAAKVYSGPAILPHSFAQGLSVCSLEEAIQQATELYAPHEIALLTRTNHWADKLTESLEQQGFEIKQQEQKQLLPLLRWFQNPRGKPNISASGPRWTQTWDAKDLESWKITNGDRVVDLLSSIELDEPFRKEISWWNNRYGEYRVLDAINDFALTKHELEENNGITVSTTHQAKGREWPCVIAIAEPMRWIADDEHFVWYVALTRVIERLFVVAPEGPTALFNIVTEALHLGKDTKD